jgi:hypothetical protein
MRNLVHRGIATGLLIAALAVAMTGCGAGNDTAPAAPSSSAGSDIAVIGREYSKCVRDHGVPNYPDMVDLGGRLGLPDGPGAEEAARALKQNKAVQDACKPILDRLPASAQKAAAPTQEEMRKLLQYAECMRANGVPEWPDPTADGEFPIKGTGLEREIKSPRLTQASETCEHLEAGK